MSLSSDAVTALHQQADGTMWVGTTNGLNRMHARSAAASAGQHPSFDRFLHDPDRLQDDYLVQTLMSNVPADPSVRGSVITAMCEDPHEPHILWITTQAGLVRFDTRTGAMRTYVAEDAPVFVSVVADPNVPHVFWAASIASGLYRFDARTGDFNVYRHQREEPGSLVDDSLVQLYVDRSGLIWVVGFFSAVDRFNPQGLPFTHERHIPGDPRSLVENTVWGLAEDVDGTVWVTTQAGLSRYHPATGEFSRLMHNPNDRSTPSSDEGFAVLVDSKGTLWLGTTATGVDRLGRFETEFENFRHDPVDSMSLTAGAVYAIYEDKAGTIWVGTSRGLNRFDATEHTFRRVSIEADQEHDLVVFDVHRGCSRHTVGRNT